jgi:glycosyltransferase involved in cell wall biosynthesis
MILAIQSTTFGAVGGIPSYNRLLCRALNELPESEQSIVLIATDSELDIAEPGLCFPKVQLHAFNQNRVALTRGFFSLALRHDVDWILVGHVNYAPLAWMMKRLKPRLKYGVMLYGIEAWRPLSNVRKRAVQRADFLISISDFTRQKAVEANELDPSQVHLLPNALHWLPAEPLQIDARKSSLGVNLLSVCRLDRSEQYKGVDRVIECLPELAKRIPAVHYTVIGAGSDLERHRALAKNLGVSNLVQFLGFVSDDELSIRYRDCDVFVMPSAGEGFGFVFLEAMKYGKPIIAARSGGVPEVVLDGVNGKLVEYGDKQQLLDSLLELCLNQDLRQSLGQAGYQRLQENYTFEHFKQKFSEIIRLESPAQAAPKFSTTESHSCAS